MMAEDMAMEMEVAATMVEEVIWVEEIWEVGISRMLNTPMDKRFL